MASWARLCIDVLQGIPAIVIGIVIYIWVVKPMGGFSAVSGSVAIALMMLPCHNKSHRGNIDTGTSGLKGRHRFH